MADPNILIPRGPLTIVKVTSTVTSLQTRTSTTVFVTSKDPPLATGPATSPPIIVETETSRIVKVFTVTLTPVFTITRTGITPERTPGVHTTSLPSLPETSPGNSAPPGPTTSSAVPHHGATSALAISSSPRSPFPESSGSMPSTTTLPPTSLGDPSTELPILPSGAPGEGSRSNKALVQILPSVLLPLFLIIVLTSFIFLKRRRRRRSTATPILHPFNSSNTSRPTTFRGNMFVMKKQENITTDVGGETLNISGGFGNPSNLHYGDRGAFNNSQIEGGALPVVNEEPELPVDSSDNLVVPATRSEIQELQTRLANIEARRISLPPPEYSSQRGY